MSRRALPTRFVVNCLLTLVPGIVGAQRSASGTGRVEGVVRDTAGRRLRSSAVSIAGERNPRTLTDDSGSFRIAGIAPGRAQFIARHIGFLPETLDVVVLEGQPNRVDFVLRSVAVMTAEVIHADSAHTYKMAAFNKRRARGIGVFITRDEIEKRQSASVSELLRYVPGVTVSQRMAGEPQPIHMQRSSNPTNEATCTVLLYVDGNPYPNGSVDDFPPGSIEGIEVYRSASEIPAEFRTRDSMCGLIALWTRDPEAAGRRP
jgi:Carboxypeptidase regulatory-like domain/TonB-dependent Receptor Plug Domain